MKTKYFRKKTFHEVADEYMRTRKNDLRSTSRASYEHLLEKRINPICGEIQIKLFSNDDLQNFIDVSFANGYGRHSIRDCTSIIKLVLKYGAKMGYCKIQTLDVKYPREHKKKVEIMSQEEYKTLLDFCMNNPGNRTFVTLIAMTTGLRIGEACALKYGDIDYKNMLLHVERSVKRVCPPGEPSIIEISAPKTDSSVRTVPILPEVAELLMKCQCEDDVYISSGNRDMPLEPRSYRMKYNRILKKLGIQHYTFHALRHTFASRCINAGADARTVADILGHTNVEMTLNTYTHSTNERRRRIASDACAVI